MVYEVTINFIDDICKNIKLNQFSSNLSTLNDRNSALPPINRISSTEHGRYIKRLKDLCAKKNVNLTREQVSIVVLLLCMCDIISHFFINY